jgi:anti-sigma regulatory factor (Ser/Thr protein kinase)
MEVIDQLVFAMTDPSQAGAVRRAAGRLGSRLGFDADEAGKAALVASEAATNVVKHARDGELVLCAVRDGDARGVGIVALDHGPGIPDVVESLRDGFSTAGSPGTGLGAIRRLSTTFDVYSRGDGTVLVSFLWSGTRPPRAGLEVDGLSVAKPGEETCGDGWAVVQRPGRCVLLVADGLGHGPEAATAAREARRAFLARSATPVLEILRGAHDALRPTRGAAAAVADIDLERRLVRFAGVGNISGTVIADGATRSMVSQHGVLGHGTPKLQDFTYPWPPGATIVLHSDGLTSRWTLDRYPGITRRLPLVAAAVLYRDFRRGGDDTTVVVVREAA